MAAFYKGKCAGVIFVKSFSKKKGAKLRLERGEGNKLNWVKDAATLYRAFFGYESSIVYQDP